MEKRTKNVMVKKIVITGHSRGIGKKLADYFYNSGHEVIGISRSKSNNINIIRKCNINNGDINDVIWANGKILITR